MTAISSSSDLKSTFSIRESSLSIEKLILSGRHDMDSKYQILILDDDRSLRDLLSSVLEKDYFVLQAEEGIEALSIMQSIRIDLVLTDMMMPGSMSGIEFIRKARKRFPDTAYIIVSGNNDIQSTIDAFHSGIYDYIKKPITGFPLFLKTIKAALEKRELLLENKLYKNHLEELVDKRTKELKIKNRELHDSRSQLVGILSRAAEFKDYETGQHVIRVSNYSTILARKLNMDEDFIQTIQMASPLHDIGKIGIPESILLKKGKLDKNEIKEIQKHPVYGEEILTSQFLESRIFSLSYVYQKMPDSDNLLETAINIAKFHHERFDGTGYPYRLVGDEIPIEARIVAIADVFDALGSSRPYKESWDNQACFQYLSEQKGKQFDPDFVEAFLNCRNEILEVSEQFHDNGDTNRPASLTEAV